jgi:hypothetical protein
MAPRRPPHMPVETWIEHQIRIAQANGAFDNLPGAGRPIPDLDRPQPELAWVANYLRREDVDIAGLLPPGLALAKEVEDLPVRLHEERSEARVRAIVDDLNARIAQAHARPQVGPPLRVRSVPVEETVAQWHAPRAAARSAAAARPAPTDPPAPPARRRRWWRRAST